MTPIIYTGPPDIEHGGNLPRQAIMGAMAGSRAFRLYSLRGKEDLPIHGAAVIVESPDERYVLHTSDDVESWLAAGWRITSY